MGKALISLVVPAYNEEKNLPLLFQEISDIFRGRPNYDYELVFVNDGSTDGTWSVISDLTRKDTRVKGIDLSRNFGKELAITAGLHTASGDACIVMDADLQHPPRHIPEFLEKWEKGAEVVIGIRESNKSAGIFKRLASWLYAHLMIIISDEKFVPRATDFRLIDRKVIDEFRRFPERVRIARNLIDWLGFKRDFIHFAADQRAEGYATYSVIALIRLALTSFTHYSLFPLRVAGYLGILTCFFSGLLGFYMFINQIILKTFWSPIFSGTAMLATLTIFLIGIVLMCLGFIALYIGNIHKEVLGRHLYIVREQINFNAHENSGDRWSRVHRVSLVRPAARAEESSDLSR